MKTKALNEQEVIQEAMDLLVEPVRLWAQPPVGLGWGRFTQGGSWRATLGFETESPWDSATGSPGLKPNVEAGLQRGGADSFSFSSHVPDLRGRQGGGDLVRTSVFEVSMPTQVGQPAGLFQSPFLAPRGTSGERTEKRGNHERRAASPQPSPP